MMTSICYRLNLFMNVKHECFYISEILWDFVLFAHFKVHWSNVNRIELKEQKKKEKFRWAIPYDDDNDCHIFIAIRLFTITILNDFLSGMIFQKFNHQNSIDQTGWIRTIENENGIFFSMCFTFVSKLLLCVRRMALCRLK